jgi:hypothetical protein
MPEPIRITWPQVLAFRTERHGLRVRDMDSACGVASVLCGLHAQLMSSAELSVVARSSTLETSDVKRSLARRELVKTWMMRGTLHLFDAVELPLYSSAGTLRRGWQANSWLQYQHVTREQMQQIVEVVPRVLEGRELTREELADEIAKACDDSDLAALLRSGWGDLLKPSAYRGDLCFGLGRGRNVTFARPRDWISQAWTMPTADDAMAEIVRRFLRTYGPAAREDFARWWGCPPAEAGRAFGRLGPALTKIDVEGYLAYVLADDADAITSAYFDRDCAVLLPAFDPYIGASAPRAHDSLVPTGYQNLVYRSQGWQSPVMVQRGRMIGAWRHDARDGAITISFAPFSLLEPAAQAAYGAEAARLAAAMRASVKISWN